MANLVGAPSSLASRSTEILDLGKTAVDTLNNQFKAAAASLKEPSVIDVDLKGTKANINYITDLPGIVGHVFGNHGLEERIKGVYRERTNAALANAAQDPAFAVQTILGKPIEINYSNASGRVVDAAMDNQQKVEQEVRKTAAAGVKSALKENSLFQSLPENNQRVLLSNCDRAMDPEYLKISMERKGAHEFSVTTTFDTQRYAIDTSRQLLQTAQFSSSLK